jgi:arsenate reductase
MGKIQIWHNSRCSKSRQGLAFLKERNLDPEIIDYMKKGINENELAKAIEKSNTPLEEFIRTNERDFKLLGLEIENLTPQSFAEIAVKHPRLLQRPIIVTEEKAVIGRPTDKISEVL